MTVKAAQEAGLNVDAGWVDGALHQISQHGQGSMSALGYKGKQESRWTSGQRARTETIDEEPSDSSPTIWGRLIAVLRPPHDR